MQLQDVKKLVSQGEGLHIEFKRKANFPEKIMKEAVAFANTAGGYLFIGVDDSGAITGVAHPDEDHYLMEHALETLITPAMAYSYERVPVSRHGDSVLVYHIPEQEGKPYYVKAPDGELIAYVRREDRSIQASPQVREIMKLATRRKQLRFEFGDKERELLKYIDRMGSITLEEFATLADIPKKRASRTLVLMTSCNVIRVEPNENADRYYLSEGLSAVQEG